ncbi:lactate permease [Photobacterium jeanii]|uniref:L-lactate permease n=1 Tax=Photobacterium jeanii TaxID=858640 RepID=A0A178K1I8_9GAMM|nr:L-lactate permease [Photobacterium jeanii]OAN10967.1 lactate permease [Photobacterium jeanii]PST90482.1 L-lactate permease [Photobacterium jeanii]
MTSLFLSIIPIIILIWMMTKKNGLPSHIALPITALMVGALQLFYFGTDLTLISANIIAGILSAITPISIVAGAILLNRMIYLSGSEDIIRRWLEGISKNQVAQLMIIGWAFAFMIEGASGFGTPAAIAAPILVGLGFNPLKVAMLALVMNSVPVSFGAVGTPTWFGFSNLGLDDATLLATGKISALIHFVAAFVIPPLALRFIVSWQTIRQNYLFVLTSTLSCTVPYFMLAQWNYEFPALVGGAIGLILSVVVARFGLGLAHKEPQESVQMATGNETFANADTSVDLQVSVRTSNSHSNPLGTNSKGTDQAVPFSQIIKAMTPTILLITILIVTRIKQLGIKPLLTDSTEIFTLSLGPLGDFSISQALILKLSHIFGTDVSWAYKTLYVPALIPFLLVVLISIPLFKLEGHVVRQMFSETANRIKMPFIALVGALIMVKLMMTGGENSPIMTTGQAFSDLMGTSWQFVGAYLGALGAFFSGSATVSNLTFGAIQQTIAINVGLPQTTILALQSVGGAMGNMVCINNIIAVSTILGIANKEGYIIKRTVIPMLIYGIVAAIMSTLV